MTIAVPGAGRLAALLAVLAARDGPGTGPVRVVADERVLSGLLAREKVFWLGSAKAAGLTGPGGIDGVTAAQTVAVACLIPVSDETGAAAVLQRVPGLADMPTGQLRQIARWLRQLYPAGEPGPGGTEARWWGGLQPDLLAEQHATSQLADAPDLARACLRDLTAGQARGALTVLARACAHRPQARAIITAALRADLGGLGVAAVAVAVQTRGELGEILADVLGDADVPLETLIEIEEAIPYPTVALAAADALLARRITQILPGDTDRDERARWLYLLAVRLSQAGQPHHALPPAQEAVTTYRELAAASPDRYRPDLAGSLTNLGIWFSALGRPAEALPVTQEAVTTYRELAAASPDRYRPDLAAALDNLAGVLSELGENAGAESARAEAAAVRARSSSV